jgi:hypothetical protein
VVSRKGVKVLFREFKSRHHAKLVNVASYMQLKSFKELEGTPEAKLFEEAFREWEQERRET